MKKDKVVYGIYDPFTNELFYIGKGDKYRPNSHLKPSLRNNPNNTTNPFLYHKIASIVKKGNVPEVRILYDHLTETEAYTIEEELIQKHGRRFSEERGTLFNICDKRGGPSGYHCEWSNERRERHQTFCKSKRVYDPSYEELYEDYIVKDKSREDLAKENECSVALVKRRLQYYRIKKDRNRYKIIRNCCNCSKTFYDRKSGERKYCSSKCYQKGRRVTLENDS